MREYVLRLHYERGVHPVMDVFIEQPELIATSQDVSASLEGGWRIIRVTGPTHALEALEEVYLDPSICNDCTYPHPACDGEFTYDVLESSPNARTVYKYASNVSYCHSVTFLALRHFGEGLVFDTEQRGRTYRYRILIPVDKDVSGFQTVLDNGLPAGVSFDIERISKADSWGRRGRTVAALPFEQRQALETALQMGYYETPRSSKLADIAAELDLPTTTLRYRLRRAEEWGINWVMETIPDNGELDELTP